MLVTEVDRYASAHSLRNLRRQFSIAFIIKWYTPPPTHLSPCLVLSFWKESTPMLRLSLSLSLLLLSSQAQDADSKLVLSRTKLSRFEKDYIFDSADTKGFTVVYRLIFHLLNIISIGHRAHTMYIGVHVPGASGSKRRSHHRRHRHHRHHYQPGIAEEASNLADNCTSLFIKYHRPFQITELMIKLLKWIHMFVCSDHSTIAARSVHFGRRGRWRRRRTRIASTFLWNGRTVLQQRRRWGWMEWNCSVSCHYDDETSTLWAFLKWIAFF